MKKRAFSLIEIVVATVILVFMAVGIFAGFVASKRYSRLGYHRLYALNLARQSLEDLKTQVSATTWNSLDLNENPFALSQEYILSNITGVDNIVFNRSYNVSGVDMDNSGTADSNEPRSVTLTVSWEEYDVSR